MNLLQSRDATVLGWALGPSGSIAWRAAQGEEIIDGITKQKLVGIDAYNPETFTVMSGVGRRQDGSLSFSPGLIVQFLGEPGFIITGEDETKILMEPEFSLEEIEQGQEIMDGLIGGAL